MNGPETKELIFTRPTRFYFYYLKTAGESTMRFCVGAVHFDCKALEIRCPTKVVFQENSPRAIVEGYTTRIEIRENDDYLVHG